MVCVCVLEIYILLVCHLSTRNLLPASEVSGGWGSCGFHFVWILVLLFISFFLAVFTLIGCTCLSLQEVGTSWSATRALVGWQQKTSRSHITWLTSSLCTIVMRTQRCKAYSRYQRSYLPVQNTWRVVCRGGSRIWSGGPEEFWPQGGPWAHKLLIIAWFKKKSWGRGAGALVPPGSASGLGLINHGGFNRKYKPINCRTCQK